MRLLRAIRAYYHASRALRLQRLADAHAAKADALLAFSNWRRQNAKVTKSNLATKLHPAERILLGSILGLGIAGGWIWICARASL